MRLEDTATGKPLASVGIALQEREARELRDALNLLLGNPNLDHEHVAAEGHQVELTVCIEGERTSWGPQ